MSELSDAFQVGSAMGTKMNNFWNGFANGGQDINGGAGAPSLMDRIKSGQLSSSEGFDKFHADAQKAKALRQVITAYSTEEADPEKAKAMVSQAHSAGLGDLEGLVQGHVVKQTLAELMAKIGEQKAQTQFYQDRGGDYKAQANQRNQDNAADQNFTQQFLQSTSPQMQPGGPVTGTNGSGGSPVATMMLGAQPAQQPNPTPQDILKQMLQAGIRPEVALQRAGNLHQLMAGNEMPKPVFGISPSGTGYAQLGKDFTWDPTDIANIRQKNAKEIQDAKPDPTKMTDAQRQSAITAHGKSRAELLKLLTTTPPDMVDTRAAINEELASHQQAISELRTPAKPAAPAPKPSASDLKYLQAHPEQWQNFEKRFGKGSSNDILP